jgi:hypothetical protein
MRNIPNSTFKLQHISKSLNEILMCGSCHIPNVLISVEYQNCHQTLDVYLLFVIIEQIQSKLIYIFVTYELASLEVTSL